MGRGNNKMRKAILLTAISALAGCAYPNPEHVKELNALVGRSESDLIHALGVPSRTFATSGHLFLAYSKSRIETIPGSPGYYGGWGWGWGWGWGGWGGGFPPEIVQRDCETTFDLMNGIVQSYTLRGNDC